MAAGPSVDGLVVQGRAKHLGLGGATRVGPRIYGRDRMAAGIEAEEAMPECRDTDRARVLGRPIRMDGVQTPDDRLQEVVGIVLYSAIPGQPGRVLNLVGAPGDWPTVTVIERRAHGRGPDVERDDH